MDPNTLVLLAIALLNAWVALMAWRTKRDIHATKIAVEKTEVNTNHMREQLVEATGVAAHAAGRDEMRQEAEATAATLAQGAKQERDKT
jgi:hypothetical protein